MIREILLFTLGILLIVYSSLNISISPSPEDIVDIPNQFGKTFCMPITSISPTSQEGIDQMKSKMNNAYALMILSLVGGIFLVLVSFAGVWHSTLTKKIMAAPRQISRQLTSV